MSKNKPAKTHSRPESSAREANESRNAEETKSAPFLSSAGMRETIESLAIAFVLAFLFRTFEAEAFVIPTGSMAPTLMGRHKDLVCPMCGYPYRLGASEEVDVDGNPIPIRDSMDQVIGAVKVTDGTCPMCRYTANLRKDFGKDNYPRSYNGDRILVDKLAYDFAEPKRWDVVVFHYPNDATTNYIKRLVGMPGETLRIEKGDIWTRRPGDTEFHIERKPPERLLAMLQPVFDNDYMPEIAKRGWPARWTPEAGVDDANDGWKSEDAATFVIDGKSPDEQWLRYRHLVPTKEEWKAQVEGRATFRPEPQLIKDFVAFDTSRTQRGNNLPAGANWVGDLALECTVDVESDAGVLTLELRKAGRRFQARFDIGWSQVSLSAPDGTTDSLDHPKAVTAIRGKGRHRIRFSNCDNELLLWVDGNLVKFDKPTTYERSDNTQSTDADYSPVGVAAKAANVRVSHLRLFRDIYYIAAKWPQSAPPNVDSREGYVEFTLDQGKFLMLGDNSSNSQDSRLWASDSAHPHPRWSRGNDLYWVDRDLLIGRAMFVYWPHSWYYLPILDIPLWPNFARMGVIR